MGVHIPANRQPPTMTCCRRLSFFPLFPLLKRDNPSCFSVAPMVEFAGHYQHGRPSQPPSIANHSEQPSPDRHGLPSSHRLFHPPTAHQLPTSHTRRQARHVLNNTKQQSNTRNQTRLTCQELAQPTIDTASPEPRRDNPTTMYRARPSRRRQLREPAQPDPSPNNVTTDEHTQQDTDEHTQQQDTGSHTQHTN
jgi:hypothetical protein